MTRVTTHLRSEMRLFCQFRFLFAALRRANGNPETSDRDGDKRRMKEDTPAFVADTDLMAALEACGQLHCCKSDETLFRQGEMPEALYLLQEGQVTLTARSGEKECVFARQRLRGSIFGLPGVISNTPYSLTARARIGSQLQVISRQAFHQMLSANPEMSFHALRILAAEVQAARRILHDEEDTQRSARHSGPRGAQSRKSGNSDRITS